MTTITLRLAPKKYSNLGFSLVQTFRCLILIHILIDSLEIGRFWIKKSYLAPRLREIKRNEINNSSLNLTAAKYRYASELGVSFHNSKLVYTVVNFVFQVFSFSLNKEKKKNRLWPVRCCRAIAAVTQPFFMLLCNALPTKLVRFSATVFWMSHNVPPKKQLRGKLTFMGRSVAWRHKERLCSRPLYSTPT